MILLRPRARLLVALLLLSPAGVSAQEIARVRTEENFRRAPNGEILARLGSGTALAVVGRRGDWLEVDLEGWVWLRSLQESNQAGYDLVVGQQGGENLRDGPNGEVLGRVMQGMLLEELERQPAWIRVRRRGFIWRASVVETAAAPPAVSEPAATRPATGPAPGVARSVAVVPGGGAILDSPDGDTLARAAEGVQMQVVQREGNWARVRLEGWAWLPPTDVVADDGAAAITPADLAEAPGEHRGRIVAWNLQFISLERAERVRTDFFEGEPFLLARFGDAEGPFVYVAVPPERLSEVEGLTPLEHVSVTGRVRTGASSLTGTPIIDLLALERAPGSG